MSVEQEPGGRPLDADPWVLGTAGHIDHGKTALVRALTGQDLDRLPEERARGITIELGFTPLDLGDDLRLALVDVPGHEGLVRTMVSGASGIDLVMLVVAADEGVMPQTREHLAICELLGIERGLAVLSKADLVDDEMLELAEAELRDLLAGGPLAGMPIVPASAVDGRGVDRVRETLRILVADRPRRAPDPRPARLFVDRVFAKRGFGAVVTGTWSGRNLSVGDAVVLEPGARGARIRGLERHGEPQNEATRGARIAVNLQGVGSEEIHRGDLLTEPEALAPTTSFDAELDWRGARGALGAPISVELLLGTSERRARLAPIGEAGIEPGGRGFVRIHVEGAPLGLLPGDRFVVRGFARDAGVGATLGGGRILDVAPPRRRRTDPRLLADLERLAQPAHATGLAARIARSGLGGIALRQLSKQTGLPIEALEAELSALDRSGIIILLEGGHSVDAAAANRLTADLCDRVSAFHAESPLQPGMPRAALLGALPANVPNEISAGLLARAVTDGRLRIDSELVARGDFTAQLPEADRALAERLAERWREAGLETPALRTLAEESGEAVERVRALAHFLEREGRCVAAPEELFFDRTAVDALIERVRAHFDVHEGLDTQTFKALIGTSRRTAMPLMALLDDLQITRRDGSVRRLLKRRDDRGGASRPPRG